MNKYDDYVNIDSGIDGPRSALFAGTHGNESCGILAFQELLPNLKLDRGSVIFAYGNPRAIEQNVRFTEFNLNRAFADESHYDDITRQTYEYNRAQVLKEYLKDASALLDIHSSASIESEPFIICESNAKDIVDFFPKEFNKIAYGFGSLQKGGTDGYMNDIGNIGICIECGNHNDPVSVLVAKNTIMSFLEARGHIEKTHLETAEIPREVIQMKQLYRTKTDSFNPVKAFADFEFLKKSDSIGVDGDEIITAPHDSIILFARSRTKVGEEGFLLGEIIH